MLIMNVPDMRPEIVLIEIAMHAGGCAESVARIGGFELRKFQFEGYYVSDSGVKFFITRCELVCEAMVGLSELSNKGSMCLHSRGQIHECFCYHGIVVSVCSRVG